MGVKTDIMAKKASGSNYNARNEAGKFAKTIRKELSGGGNWTVTPTEEGAVQSIIDITFENNVLKEGIISTTPKLPKQDGSVKFKIVLKEQDAVLYIDDELATDEEEGTELNPYRIYTIEDLVDLSKTTNGGNSYEGKTVELMNDLDFNDNSSYEQYDRTDYGDINENGTVEALKTELTTGKGFCPIGTSNALTFKGTFEGNYNSIKHLYIDRATFTALFGNSYTIKNLTLKDGHISGTTGTAAVAAVLRNGKVDNCHNDNTEVIMKAGEYYTLGGIVGQLSSGTEGVFNCTNSGTITALGKNNQNSSCTGGIVGYALTPISNCHNTGTVTGVGQRVGGIAGVHGIECSINSCTNRGKVDGGECFIGGISGLLVGSSQLSITNCENSGNVSGTSDSVGGITGFFGGLEMSGCNNSGNITAKFIVGGITGSNEESSTVTGCNNTGTVTGNSHCAGGIIGSLYPSSTMTKCDNTGTVTCGGIKTGGIAGEITSTATIIECSNTGAVTGAGECTGGIAGLMLWENNASNSRIEKCYNSGEINGVKWVGGILGFIDGLSGERTLIKCYNKGTITGTTKVGEILGEEANTTGLNTINRIFYLINSRGLTAIGGEADNVNKKIMGVSDNLTFEQFKTWIESQ